MLQQIFFLFFFNDTATTEIYTLSLHDALPISRSIIKIEDEIIGVTYKFEGRKITQKDLMRSINADRSEEHTSELQSQSNLVCRLLLEKKKKNQTKSARYMKKYKHEISSISVHT